MQFFLTFDTEDFISANSTKSIELIVESLNKYDLKGLFFITGHMAERLSTSPDTVSLLNMHQIGYHSSSHSVHPAIFEFADIEDYQDAYHESLIRETSHINPLTGAIEGKGGLCALKDLFPGKEIVAFRAPGHCWSPPHLEALKSLGIRYDFSAYLSNNTVNYKGIVFYPYPIGSSRWCGTFSEYFTVLNLLKHRISVFTVHPSLMVNQSEWDAIYFGSNPQELRQPVAMNPDMISYYFQKFNLLLKQLHDLQKLHLIEVTPSLEPAQQSCVPTQLDVEKSYRMSVMWTRKHGYKPKYLKKHFLEFFKEFV